MAEARFGFAVMTSTGRRADDSRVSAHEFILAGQIAVAGGCVILIAMLVGAIQFDRRIVGVAVAAVLGGIVAAGSSHSTAKEATHELTAAEAKWTALIGQIDLRLVSNNDY